MTRFFSAILFLLFTFQGFTQDYKRTFNWYFGDSAGMSFASAPPSALSNGKMFSWEGCASISDTNGNLLFYTNGERIWNKNHQFMEMGDVIFGHSSSTQSSIIVPQPGNDSMYYLFTTPETGNTSAGLRMAIINMNANGGLGKVIVRNTKLQSPVCEKLTATHHQNGKDIWVVAHGFKDPGKDNLFYCYLVTEKGLVNCPVLTNIGAEHYKYDQSITNAQGAMKFSPDGKRLAVTVYNQWQNYIELFDFNKNTGAISNMKRIPVSGYLPYGVEFSSSGKKMYVTTRGNDVYQYSLNAYDSLLIRQSETLIFPRPNGVHNYHTQIQLGADGKIYLAIVDSNFLTVVNYPDSFGSSCGFQLKGPILSSGSKSEYGLPNFITSYFKKPEPDFQYSINCVGNIGTFSPHNVLGVQKWNIKKTGATVGTTYTNTTAQHTFNDSGEYAVTLYTTNNDTITKTIYVDAPILPKTDTLGCGVDSVVLNVPSSYRCLQWSDTSAQFYSRTITANGTYTIQGYNSQGCLITDSIRINFTPSPSQPVIIKNNDSLYSSSAFGYQWFLNDTAIIGASSQSIKPLVAGMYKVLITDSNGCSNVSTAYSSNVGEQELNKTSIKVYPNPAFENIIIKSDAEIESIMIHDAIGRTTYEQFQTQKTSLKISCTSFAKGIYFIQVKANNNTYCRKIIVQ